MMNPTQSDPDHLRVTPDHGEVVKRDGSTLIVDGGTDDDLGRWREGLGLPWPPLLDQHRKPGDLLDVDSGPTGRAERCPAGVRGRVPPAAGRKPSRRTGSPPAHSVPLRAGAASLRRRACVTPAPRRGRGRPARGGCADTPPPGRIDVGGGHGRNQPQVPATEANFCVSIVTDPWIFSAMLTARVGSRTDLGTHQGAGPVPVGVWAARLAARCGVALANGQNCI